MSEQAWDERYAAAGRVWSGQPNLWLVEVAAGLPAGTAADLGCGEGADAIWLAARGWSVTAVDFSARGLATAQAEAALAQVHVHWVRSDLAAWQPPGTYDLVSVQFLHAPPEQRAEIHRRAWAATAGTLLIVGHDVSHRGGPPDELKYGPPALLAGLGLAPEDPAVVTAEIRSRDEARDSVVVLRR